MPQGRPWERYGAQPQREAPPPVIYGPPKQLDPVEAERLELSRRADARAERAEAREAQRAEIGKALPDTAAKRYEDSIGIYARLKNAQGGFQDDYAGNTFTGNAENWLQSLNSGIGTPGQRQWWADFVTLDNQIRNELFGATLTPSEQAAYARTTISPSMDPRTIRENLAERERVVKGALRRRTDYLKKSGYNTEAIDALAGEYAADISTTEAAADSVTHEGDIPAEAQALSVDSLADFATGLSGGRYEINDDGSAIYYPGDGTRQRVELGEQITSSDEYRRLYKAKFGRDAPVVVNVEGASPTSEPARGEEYLSERGFAGWDAALAGGLADVLTLGLSDEISAAGATIFDGGTMAQNLKRAREQDKYDQENYPLARMGGQLAGALVPFGAGALRAPRSVAPSRAALRGAGEGAALGAAYGFGSAEGGFGERAQGALVGGLIGGGVGGVAGALSGRFGSRGGPPDVPPPSAVSQAAERQGIDMLPADAGGGLTRGATAIARQGWISEAPITAAAERAARQAGKARDNAASAVGKIMDKDDAGEAVRRAANIYSKETGRTGEALYERAFGLAGNAQVTPRKALEVLDKNIAELSETPGGSALLTELRGLRESLGSGAFSIRGIRNMRSRLREEADFKGLRGGDTERRLKEVVQAASEDLMNSLTDSGNSRAASAFRTADAFWRKRVETIDDVLDPVLGKSSQRSGEHILSALERMANKETGDAARLRRLMRALPDSEASGVRATVIQRLGQPKPGQQTDQSFSFNEFLTRWNSMSDKSKAIMFPGDSIKALDDIATYARGAKRAAAYSNSSNTGRALAGQFAFSAIVSGAADIMTAGKVAAGQFALGKLLASPTFAKFLARVPRMDAETAVKGLGKVAKRDPAIAQDALGLQRYLQQAISQTPSRAAAGEEEQQ